MKAALFGKTILETDVSYVQGLVDRLESSGCLLYLYKGFYTTLKDRIRFVSTPVLFTCQADIRGNVDFLFSIGGDGTLLDTITLVGDSGIPVIGINTGRLGFLSGIPKEEIVPALEDIIAQKFTLDERTLLRLESPDALFGEFSYALNDFTLYRSSPNSLLTIKMFIDDEFLNTYWADGLIIATPTGSTAYSMSCNGPILMPHSANFVVTPIASHNLSVRPIVIPDSSVIRVIIESRNTGCHVGLDSRTRVLEVPQEFILRKENFKISLLRLPGRNFFETIRAKLKWGLDIRN
jgi:NAD+ kinase